MISIAGLRKPKLNNGIYYDDDRKLLTSKIESIFKIALANGHDSLVLGAIGCGVFKNPPIEVANIFKIMIRIYGKHFKKIGFAILIVKETDQDNINTFKKVLRNK